MRFHRRFRDDITGSVQVISFSWVFPFAAAVVLCLMLLSFLLVFYVYSFHIAEETADQSWHAAVNEAAWTETDGKTHEEIHAEMEKKFNRISFIPGVSISRQLTVHLGSVTAAAECSYFGKHLFSVRVRRNLPLPIDGARKWDLMQFLKKEAVS